jgi:hypothetical protein
MASITAPPVSARVAAEMLAQTDKLADAQVPGDAPAPDRAALSSAVVSSYLIAFRIAMFAAALLAIASVLITAVMLPSGRLIKEPEPS